MKKMMMIAVMLVASLGVSAQNDELKNEIGVYYGFGAAPDIVSTYYTVMPAVKFNWLRKDYFGMYSGVAAGLMVASLSGSKNGGSDSKVDFMGHLTALGAEFGGQLRGFAELGFGERGVFTLGLRYKF